MTHILGQRLIVAEIVVFDIDAPYANRAFEQLVCDLVALRLHVFDHAVADPFAQCSEVTKPAECVGRGTGWSFRRHLFPEAVFTRSGIGVLECFAQRSVQRCQQSGGNDSHDR